MKELLPDWKFLDGLLQELDKPRSAPLRIQIQTGIPYMCLRLALAGKSVFVLADEERAEIYAQDLKALAPHFPDLQKFSIGFLPYQDSEERMALFEDSLQKKGLVWTGTLESFHEKSFGREEFSALRRTLKVGKPIDHADFVRFLSERGYRRTDFVEEVGQFSVRGEVFDFWSSNSEHPVRIVFDMDVVESLHSFDAGSQRTLSFLIETVAIPLSEKKLGAANASAAAYLPENCILLLCDPRFEEEPQLLSGLGKFPMLQTGLSGLPSGILPASRVHLNWEMFKKELEDLSSRGARAFAFTHNMGEMHRLEDILDDVRAPVSIWPQISIAPISEGFASAELGLAVWAFSDLTGVKTVRRRQPKFSMGRSLESMSDIKSGDYVVHEHYGIGRFRGLEKVSLKMKNRQRSGFEVEKVSEFLAIQYKKGDRLLVPVNDFRLVQKYVAQEGKKPELYSLDGAAWEHVKQKVSKEVKEIAEEILKTAAKRQAQARGADVGERPHEHLIEEFAQAFPYEETVDQRNAIDAVYQDMDSHKLMDRVVCGDVGYGKTEIAMRAAFKAAIRSRQVAVLVPTTILAEQHYKSFTNRFTAFPIKIALLSRFQTKDEQKKTVEDAKLGHIDIVIGTHRLLSKDVHFKDLGLLIIDEEHRFGVAQKEALKKMKVAVDVLSLSATPIPRTLSFAMGGIREFSVVETPPQGRLPIETQVGIFDEDVVRQAISRELSRGGQVFYVHNRIGTIEKRKAALEQIIPGIRVGTAHGQMGSLGLEKAMWNFLHRKWDVLLSTSIIESGLDIPTVNTIIIEDSEEFGLSQLYQLRGRVGRQREKAYCYLFFSGWSHLSDDARKRLEAIQEFSTLGSGVKLALRDMEIRGTGNFLGQEQHGWVNAVGLDLYCQLLSEQIAKLKSERAPASAKKAAETAPEVPLPEIELNLAAHIPDDYVQVPGERIILYKKIASLKRLQDVDPLKGELQDRFGPIPEPLENLFRIVQLKFEAQGKFVRSIYESEKGILVGWHAKPVLPIDLGKLAADFQESAQILPPSSGPIPVLEILFRSEDESDPFTAVSSLLNRLGKYVIVFTHS